MRATARDSEQPMVPRILLLDDSEVLMKQARIALEAEGFSVEVRRTVELAATESEMPPPDVVVLDISLAEDIEPGWLFLQQLRIGSPHLPVVISTDDREVEGLVEQRLAPGTRLLKKPFGWDVLIDTINELLADAPVG